MMINIFFFLYSLSSFFIYIFTLPFLVILSFKSKYKQSIPSRFFLWRNTALKPNGIWFHSCSFGEAKAIKPLVDALSQEDLRMSTTTQTGFEEISNYTEQSRYLPFEPLLLWWTKPQKVLVVMEAEFWYLLFALAQKRGAKTLLINARMSDKSFHKYERNKWLYRRIFEHIDEVYAQTQKDKERLESLGAKNVLVTGNIKLSKLPSATKELDKPECLTICGASTHEGEEGYILDAFVNFKKENPEAKLILAPRHPERFSKVEKMIQQSANIHNFSTQKYSQNTSMKSDIILLDVLGELVNTYAISDIVILGGAFAPIGGHNAAEAAQFGCKILSGPHYFNQKDIFQAVEGITIVEASNLSRRLLQHGLLKPTKIKSKTDLSPIIKSIKFT
jgi:3-deoxy-D-manno-octulosonic-acid transferase